ncbi:RRP15-like protein [Teleopsis dalmanni]|uniref:RRP15-like protein n=1 Tax=Teleopsis dalmanni TaxID=139649 RepID=UPI0018CE5D76|nr:RRP15-like protein [Teleopsis dalmanni]
MAFTALKKEKTIKENSGTLSDDGSDRTSDEDEQQNGTGNAGWADSIAKVLNTTKPKTKKTLVLSRAKKIKSQSKLPETKSYSFEVEGEIKEEKPDKDELDDKLTQRKNVQLQLRVKPTWKDIERERTLRKIATKGVVQLFNAVRMQQKDLQNQLDEAGKLDSRQEAVLNNINKRKFLDVLMSGKRAKSEAVDNSIKNEIKGESSSDEEQNGGGTHKKKSEWNVLRDDFMTNKKIKHWDEDEEDDDNEADESISDSDE